MIADMCNETDITGAQRSTCKDHRGEDFTVGSFPQKKLIGVGLGALAGFIVSRQIKADKRTRWLTVLAGGGVGYLLSGLNSEPL